jgi:hypothetical protein
MKLLPCALGPVLTVEEALTLSSNFSSSATLPEKTSQIALGYSAPIGSYHTDFLFAYDIFPRFPMRAEPQWIREGRAMRIGDIIVQRAVLPPIGFGLCAEFAVRISALISEPSKLGFASLRQHFFYSQYPLLIQEPAPTSSVAAAPRFVQVNAHQ